MTMSMVGSLRVCDAIGVHKAHYCNHGEQTRHQSGQYLRILEADTTNMNTSLPTP